MSASRTPRARTFPRPQASGLHPRRFLAPLMAALALWAPAARAADPPPPPPPPARILSPQAGQHLQPAVQALSRPGSLPGTLRLAGLQVGSVEVHVRLTDEAGAVCTLRLGAPWRPEALERGRWLALLPDPDACRDGGQRVLALLDDALPADPWIDSSRSSPPPVLRTPTLAGPIVPRTLALATGAFGVVITLIAGVVAVIAAFRPRNDGER